jgi:hypothetical protein
MSFEHNLAVVYVGTYQSPRCLIWVWTGVEVMITIFGENIDAFLKNQLYDPLKKAVV